jgi:hypothetical protein
MRRDSRPRKSTKKTEVPKPRMTTEARFSLVLLLKSKTDFLRMRNTEQSPSACPCRRSLHPIQRTTMKIQTNVTVAIATFLLTVLPFVRILPRLQHAFGIPSAPEMPHHRAPWPSGAFSCSCGPSGAPVHSAIA